MKRSDTFRKKIGYFQQKDRILYIWIGYFAGSPGRGVTGTHLEINSADMTWHELILKIVARLGVAWKWTWRDVACNWVH